MLIVYMHICVCLSFSILFASVLVYSNSILCVFHGEDLIRSVGISLC